MANETKPMQLTYGRVDYEVAVKAAAKKLRRRFESGKLHGWRDGDDAAQMKAPWFKLEEAVAREWITGPVRALAVLDFAVYVPPYGSGWAWDSDYGCLLTAAQLAMAHDVLAYATAQGWYVPAAGEEGAEELLRYAADIIRRAA